MWEGLGGMWLPKVWGRYLAGLSEVQGALGPRPDWLYSGEFSARVYNFQCASLVILVTSMAKCFIHVDIIERVVRPASS